MKFCKHCRQAKLYSEFYPHNRTKDRLQYWCKSCQKLAVVSGYRNNPAKHAACNREWDKRNPDKKADTALKTRLGLPHGTYTAMLAAQGGKRGICGTDKPGGNDWRRFPIDHDEATGQVRGLLCNSCNNGIGRFNHDPIRLHQAISYLLKY